MKTTHSIKVKVKDSGSPQQSAMFPLEISVTDENDPPVIKSISSTQVTENLEIGSLVADLIVEDEDFGQTLTLSIGSEGLITTNFSLVLFQSLNLFLDIFVTFSVLMIFNFYLCLQFGRC